MGGRITLATDHPPYRDQIIEMFESSGAFRSLLASPGYGPRPSGFEGTIFEERWRRKGRDVFYMQFERRSP